MTGTVSMAQAALRQIRIAALIEGTTLVALVCIGVPLKYGAGIPAVTTVLGPVHGVAFVAYLWLVFSTRAEIGWRRAELARLAVPAFIPFGTFFNMPFLRRKQAQISRPG